MPKDKRIFITLAVDMDRNPKLSDLSDAQKWIIVKAIMHCREFKNDGIMKLSDWNKMATKRNRIAVESCGVVVVDETKSVAVLHDYAEHNQTRAEIEAASEAKKAAGRKGGKARAANANTTAGASERASEVQAAACDLPKQMLKQNQAEEEVEEEKELSTHLTTPAYVRNASGPRRSRGLQIADALNETARPVAVYTFMHDYEQSRSAPIDQRTLAGIENAITPLIAAGIPNEQIAAGLRLWESSDSFSATQIAAYVHKAGSPKATPKSTTDERVRAAQALKTGIGNPVAAFAFPERKELQA